MATPPAAETTSPEPELVDGELVPAGDGAVERRAAAGGVVVRQATAVAVGSFAAGVAAVAAARVLHASRATRRARRARRALPVVASRSFLVDVHMLDPRR
jgi:hypothetical protein